MKLIFPTNNVVTSPESAEFPLYPPAAYPENSTHMVLPSRLVSFVAANAFKALSWLSYSTKALPLITLHFVSAPYGSKWTLTLFSSESNDNPWTNNSNFPKFGSFGSPLVYSTTA